MRLPMDQLASREVACQMRRASRSRDPAGSAVLCDLGPDRTTRLRRPSREALDAWLQDYRGLGALRAEGYDASVFTELADSPAGAGGEEAEEADG